MASSISNGIGIRQIWRDDLENGIDELKTLTDKYDYVSVSVLWPGFVSRPIIHHDYAYTTVKDTVNLCEAIQVGFSFADAHGRKPPSSLQFNFVYHSTRSCVVEECMDALVSQGYETARAQTNGIDSQDFGECLLGSGVVMSEHIKWITYHGTYDFAFIIKSLTNSSLPETKEEFLEQVTEYFPTHYDVKYMLLKKMTRIELPQGLRSACSALGLSNLPIVSKPDAPIRSGINALLVSACFFNTLRLYFENKIDDSKFNGCLYGLEDIEEVKLPPGMLRLKPGTYNGPPPPND